MSIGPTEQQVLDYLVSHQAISKDSSLTQKTIATALNLTDDRISHITKNLVDKGLVHKKRINKGGRSTPAYVWLSSNYQVDSSQVVTTNSQVDRVNQVDSKDNNLIDDDFDEPNSSEEQENTPATPPVKLTISKSQQVDSMAQVDKEQLDAKYEFVSDSITNLSEKLLELEIGLHKVKSEIDQEEAVTLEKILSDMKEDNGETAKAIRKLIFEQGGSAKNAKWNNSRYMRAVILFYTYLKEKRYIK